MNQYPCHVSTVASHMLRSDVFRNFNMRDDCPNCIAPSGARVLPKKESSLGKIAHASCTSHCCDLQCHIVHRYLNIHVYFFNWD